MLRQSLTALLVLLGASTAAAVAADQAPLTPTGACLMAAGSDSEREACIGETARSCEADFAKPTALDIAICINTETEWWQTRLDQAHDRMMTRAADLDAMHKDSIAKGAPRMTDDLPEFQASWKDWTEKRCTFEAMMMRASPRRMIVAADCMLQQTAAQTLLLERSAGDQR